ncbi:MAG: hypothetical protein RL676_79 [Pseudomonadota bacterium]|jgi:hypothetical protein
MHGIFRHTVTALCAGWISLASPAHAQPVPADAQGLTETLISVQLEGGRQQAGVYSVKSGTQGHSQLAVLLPGYPSVVRPVMGDGFMASSKLSGNFLIRSRRHLADASIATLTVDCHSESGDYCASSYQASRERQHDVQRLINEVRQRHPSITSVWLVGTSMGTISSSFMPVHQPNAYAGAIHTASITEPLARNSYRELADFDYKKSGVPQFFVHHRDDPCPLTTHAGAKRITEKFGIPLITVVGGSGFHGQACHANTEHGFKGIERKTMLGIAAIIKTGKAEQLDLQ